MPRVASETWPVRVLFGWVFVPAMMHLLVAIPPVCAQTMESIPAHGGFDATSISLPAALSDGWLAHGGDDSAFAAPWLDDSAWARVDLSKNLSDSLAGLHPEVVWYRLHVKVDPAQTGMALQLIDPSRAFEIYVNGVQRMGAGRVAPFSPDTSQATITASIPDEQMATGTLVIALRIHFTPVEWTADTPGLVSNGLTFGREDLLRQTFWLSTVSGNVVDWTWSILAFAVAFLALMLYTAQRDRKEYLWTCLLGVAEFSQLVLAIVHSVLNLPLATLVVDDLLSIAADVLLLLVYFTFVNRRVNLLLWIYAGCSSLLLIVDRAFYLTGHPAVGWLMQPAVAQAASDLIILVIIPLALVGAYRRGNREAGILGLVLLLSTIYDYARYAAMALEKVPATAASATNFRVAIENFHLGPIVFPLSDVGGTLCWLSLAAIMVMRSNRATRRQAILEGDLAAAQQVQQVILPEQTETVPGFRVESVYQPAQQVGGDFFQILPSGDGAILAVVGDVAGKGLPAAMLVSLLVGAVRGVAAYTHDPAEVLAAMNEHLMGRGGLSTALAARIQANGEVIIANAGHLPPYLDGEEIALPGALPLGAIEGMQYESTRFQLPPGSRLVFYSDGIVEAQNARGELFGFDRARALSTQPAAAIAASAKAFGQEDDITVVTIQREMLVAAVA